jgi:prepilin-type N-terminal cleavage/methylation domain-containing protein
MENERGFTLIELLVVLAILATLFGITALALSGITSDAEEGLAETELDTVHTAMDVCDVMSACNNGSSGTCIEVGPATAGFGEYLRRSSTFFYAWDADGVITQSTESGCAGTVYYP